VELGFKVYALMRRRGIEPTVATYGTLVRGCGVRLGLRLNP
jgi:hypothetical protein